MAYKLGLNAKLYVGTAGSQAGTEITTAKDVTLTLEAAEADDSTRGGGGWGSTAASLRRASIEFEMRYDTAAAGFSTILNAFLASGLVALYARDSSGGPGLDGDFAIVGFNRNEPLEGIQTVNVTARLNTSNRNPTWA